MERKKVSELAKQIRGVSYKTEDLHENLDENSVTLLRANNIFEGRINFDDVVYVDKSRVAREQYLCKGDILVCASSGSKQLVGKAASFNFDTECTFGAFCKVVRPNQDVANYLSMYFQSNAYRRKISEVAIGANINNIRNEHIDALELPIGSNAENEKVVASFSLLQQIIDGRKQQLHKLDDLIKARFVELFGDESNPYNFPIVTIEDVASVQVGVVIKPAQYYTDAGHGIKTFRSLNIGPMHIKDTDWVYFSEEGNRKNQKSVLNENDLVIVRSGAPGTACVITKEYAGCNAVDIIIARPDLDKVNPYYLCQYTNLPHGKKQIEEGTGGAAQQHFNVGKYNKIRLTLPPLDQQLKFEKFVNQTDKSKVVVQKALDEAQTLFDSLMQKYFG